MQAEEETVPARGDAIPVAAAVVVSDVKEKPAVSDFKVNTELGFLNVCKHSENFAVLVAF